MRWRNLYGMLILALLIPPLVYAYPAEVANVRKTIIRELEVLPGYGANTTIAVTLVFDRGFSGSFTDYLAFATGEGLSATLTPSRVAYSHGLLACSWGSVDLRPGDVVKYSVRGRNLFDVRVYVEADGKRLQADCSRGYCYAVALKAHTINYTVEIEAVDRLVRKQQLPISISWSIDPMYLYPIGYSENPQSLRESGAEVSFQWTSFFNGSYRLTVVFEVRGENPWGEVLVPPPTITISLDPRLQASLIERYRYFTAKLLEENIGNITAFRENATALRNLLYNLSIGFEEEARMLENASALADDAATAMDNAALQVLRGVEVMSSIEGRISGELNNASLAAARARDILSRIKSNLTLQEEELKRILNRLNTTGLNITTANLTLLLDEASAQLSKFEGELQSFRDLVSEYNAAKHQLYAGAENMRAASAKLRLMASVLRESASKLRELARGLRQAAELVDSSILKLSNLLDSPLYPASFKEFNSTILSQQTVATSGDKALRTDLMGDIVYVSLPPYKVKRSEPQVSNIGLEPPTKRIQTYWPAVLAVIAVGAYLALSSRREGHVTSDRVAELRRRIGDLKNKLQALEVGSNV
ncbi:hypothetical protein IG193_08025 [Infirmifilum lucidum]|uniref:Uncharacterized protein n=1 Tax=Infirmifilum lucidum TaxID=2776706 RepID=A0A7L9FG64_9CREN|nr:hypothetical protein [Infirmifilum lucidum]QOJ78687.1 hypothetical protein IG193_08025 [Infirmifilum lucidum]